MFAFKNLKDKMGGNKKLDNAPIPAVGETATAQSGSNYKDNKVEASDNFSTRDYLTRNSMGYGEQPKLNEVYTKEQSRMKADANKYMGAERQSYGDTLGKVRNVEAPTNVYKGAQEARAYSKNIDVLDDYSMDMDTVENYMPEMPDLNVYSQALQQLANQQQLAGGYQAGTDTVSKQNTNEVYDKVRDVESRAGMLRDQYGGDTGAYTQGMLSLDSALAERQGLDNRGLQQSSGQTAATQERQNADLSALRDSQVQTQRSVLSDLANRGSEIADARDTTTNQYNLDMAKFQTNEQQRIANEANFLTSNRTSEIGRRDEVARQAEISRQQAIEAERLKREDDWRAEVGRVEAERVANEEAYRKEQEIKDQILRDQKGAAATLAEKNRMKAAAANDKKMFDMQRQMNADIERRNTDAERMRLEILANNQKQEDYQRALRIQQQQDAAFYQQYQADQAKKAAGNYNYAQEAPGETQKTRPSGGGRR